MAGKKSRSTMAGLAQQLIEPLLLVFDTVEKGAAMVGLRTGIHGGNRGASHDLLITDRHGADIGGGYFVDAAIVDAGRRDAAPAVGMAVLKEATEAIFAVGNGGFEVVLEHVGQPGRQQWRGFFHRDPV